MKLFRFNATAVHGFLDFNLTFFPDLTFLTGINGSGKTTVVRAITALLTPSIASLAKLTFTTMRAEVFRGETQLSISATRTESSLTLGISSVDESLEVPLPPPLDSEAFPTHAIRERETDYYHDFELQHAIHPVLREFRELPAPMYLAIERRLPEVVDSDDRQYRSRVRRRAIEGPVSPLGIGLIQALELAETTWRKIESMQRELTDKLRKELLLNSLKYEKGPTSAQMKLFTVTPEDVDAKLETTRSVLEQLGLPTKDVDSQLQAFSQQLHRLYDALRGQKDVLEVIQSGDDAAKSAAFEWLVNYPQIDRITSMISSVESYIAQSRTISAPIQKYLSILNNFFGDCDKKASFDPTGTLVVTYKGAQAIPITSLSSGETQILVMITHLSFSPAAQLENAFIIDEPELSLHVRWQELFVSSIQEANPTLQLILATHSPSIILDRIDKCVDLSGSVR